MATEQTDNAIMRLYIERGARKYDALLPRPAVEYFRAALADGYPRPDEEALLDALLGPGAPRRAAPAPVAEPPLLSEVDERLLDFLEFSADRKREVREVIANGLFERVVR